MSGARRQNAFGARTGWFALAVRLLAVWLAVLTALPQAGLTADLSHHLHHPQSDLHAGDRPSELTIAPDAAVVAQAADPGLATHLHCGCHSAVPAGAAEPILADPRPRPRYGLAAVPPSSLAPDLLPRPPRA